MKRTKLPIIIISLSMAMTLLSCAYASGCNVCHSKNPKMVTMHRELGYKDCFKCHSVKRKKSPEEQKEQMMSDQRCTGCHRK